MPPPPAPAKRPLSQTLMTVAGLLVGGALFTGLATFHAIFLVPTGGGPYPSYYDTVRILFVVSSIFIDLAISVAVAVAYVMAGSRDDLSDASRRGPILFATVFTVVWLIVTSIGWFRPPFF